MFVSRERLIGAQQKNDFVGAQMFFNVVFDCCVEVVDQQSFFEPVNPIKMQSSVVLHLVHEHDENMVNPRSRDQ